MKREFKLFKNFITTKETVVKYNDYNDYGIDNHGMHTMYSMVAEYKLRNNTIIQASEQSSCNRRKYPLGTEIQIDYSQENSELFIIKGDYSLKVAMVGMIIVGLAMFIVGALYEIE